MLNLQLAHLKSPLCQFSSNMLALYLVSCMLMTSSVYVACSSSLKSTAVKSESSNQLNQPNPVQKTKLPLSTTLSDAIDSFDSKAITEVLSRELLPDYNAVSKCGYTPMYVACRMRDLPLLKLLVSNGCRINEDCGFGLTPLHKCIEIGFYDGLEFLLKHGAIPEQAFDNVGSPFAYAARVGDLRAVRMMMDAGVNVFPTDLVDNCLLMDSVKAGQVEVVEEMATHPSMCDAYYQCIGEIALRAIHLRQPKMFKALLEGCLGFKEDFEYPSYFLAEGLETEQEDVVQLVLEYPLSFGFRFGNDQLSFLHLAAKRGRIDIMKNLLEKGMSPNGCDINGQSCVYYAVKAQNTTMLILLIEYDACLDSKNPVASYETSPLLCAMEYKTHTNENIAMLLIENGANVDLVVPYTRNSNLLSLAILYDWTNVVKAIAVRSKRCRYSYTECADILEYVKDCEDPDLASFFAGVFDKQNSTLSAAVDDSITMIPVVCLPSPLKISITNTSESENQDVLLDSDLVPVKGSNSDGLFYLDSKACQKTDSNKSSNASTSYSASNNSFVGDVDFEAILDQTLKNAI